MCVIGHHSSYISLRVTRQKKGLYIACFLLLPRGVWKLTRTFQCEGLQEFFLQMWHRPRHHKYAKLYNWHQLIWVYSFQMNEWSSIKAFKGETTITIDLSFDERSLAVILSVITVAFGRSTTSRNQLEELLNNADR